MELTAAKRVLLAGNEAVARGAHEAAVGVATGYPGTPSTEVLEALAVYQGADVRWSANEKVALDVAAGASFGGVRAIATMKHVGLNVAADTFMTLAYTGVGAGLVVVSADDPGMHSSQNEQDNRVYARFAGVPLLEPGDSQEAKDFTRLAFDISETFDTPVLLRYPTRIAHTRGLVELGEIVEQPVPGFRRDPRKYVMLPANARARRPAVLARLDRLTWYVEESALTQVHERGSEVAVVTSGICYQYVREVLPEVSILKLGITHPLPVERIRAFAGGRRTFVVEESGPFLEEALLGAGIPVVGKEFFPRIGGMTPEVVREVFARAGIGGCALPTADEGGGQPVLPAAPPRPPVLCPGCPHAIPFMALRQARAVVAGDIGCYTLAALAPLEAMDTCVAMGCSIGMAVGLAASGGATGPVTAAIGDSTFLHSGIPALIEAVCSRANITVVILDNGITAMTGGQHHPGTGTTLRGAAAPAVDLVSLCRAAGVEHVEVVDPYDVGAVHTAVRQANQFPGPAVVITNRPCVEAPVKIRDRPYQVIPGACIGCQLCMNIGCPSITWGDTWYDGLRVVTVDASTCTGCTVCAQMCPAGAMTPVAGWEARPGG